MSHDQVVSFRPFSLPLSSSSSDLHANRDGTIHLQSNCSPPADDLQPALATHLPTALTVERNQHGQCDDHRASRPPADNSTEIADARESEPELFSPRPSDILNNVTEFTPSASATLLLEPSVTAHDLPAHLEFSEAAFSWGQLDGQGAIEAINAAYTECVRWRRNVFNIPSGKSGKSFVLELARLLRSYAERSSLEPIALKAAMVMPSLLLQKPALTSKAKDHTRHLERRLRAWKEGDFDGLVREARVIQQHLVDRGSRGNGDALASTFSKLMLAGKTRAALRLLDKHGRSKVLPINETSGSGSTDTVLDVLKSKHPPGQPPHVEALITDANQGLDTHPILFEGITGASIRRAALRTNGSAGPSGLDSSGWQRLCSSFKGASVDLCNAVASVARRLCTEYVAPEGLSAFIACRLLALDKCPGVRPIGVAEVLRRIVGKAIMAVVGKDVQQAVGSQQLCAGQEAGCEAAVHAMRSIFADETTEGVLLIDASNAFNRLNRAVALRNVRHLCPSIATVIINSYRADAELFIGDTTLYSQEGTTQGDPLAMAFYALATVPLSKACKVERLSGEVWFADDATGGGRIEDLRLWWDLLERKGPMYGYFPNGMKTWLIVKNEHLETAEQAFRGTSIQVTTEGRRHLGSALGSSAFVESYVTTQVSEWCRQLKTLSSIALSHPQEAYCAFTHGLKGKWSYLTRTTPGIGDLLQPLEKILREDFIPAITGRPCPGDLERELLSLPPRLGGLGITDPSTRTEDYRFSLEVTAPLIALVTLQSSGSTPPVETQHAIKKRLQTEKRAAQRQEASCIAERLSEDMQRVMALAQERGASSWLTALPLAAQGFSLHKGAFRDAVRIRYGWALENVPSHCVCGAPFTTDHAMTCPTGGYPTLRHNEVRDLTANLLNEVCSDVAIEPVLQPLSGETLPLSANREDDARLDIRARNFWGNNQQAAFFDVRIFHPNAASYRSCPISSLYRRHEKSKKRQYGARVCEIEQGCFTPLVLTTTGGMGPEATTFYKRLADLLAVKRDSPYSVTMGWLRCRLAFAMLRSALLCIRGSRKLRSSAAVSDCFEMAVTTSRLTAA